MPTANTTTRRRFLSDVGCGVLVGAVGATLAGELGLSPALAGEPEKALTFGNLEGLVVLMQETPVTRLLPVLTEKLQSGVELRTLVAAAALANARTFGGEDYVGFHTLMAIAPASVGPEVRPMIEHWARLHAGRSALGAITTLIFLWAAY